MTKLERRTMQHYHRHKDDSILQENCKFCEELTIRAGILLESQHFVVLPNKRSTNKNYQQELHESINRNQVLLSVEDKDTGEITSEYIVRVSDLLADYSPTGDSNESE